VIPFDDKDHAEVCAHLSRAWKDLAQFVRYGIGGDVEILRGTPDQQIPNTAANQPRRMAFVPQPPNY
jgi:hypothetical protein